jgi:hypothetical protein
MNEKQGLFWLILFISSTDQYGTESNGAKPNTSPIKRSINTQG